MPEIERDALKAMLTEAQTAGHDPEALLLRLKDRGYTLPGQGATAKTSVGHPADDPDMAALPPGGLPIPQEGRSEPLTPLAPVKEYLGYAADKSAQARESMAPAPGLLAGAGQAALQGAMRVGEAGLRAGAAAVPATPAEVGSTILAGPAGQAGSAVVKGAAAPFLKYGGKGAAVAGDWLADLAGAWTGKDPEYIKAVFQKPGIMQKVGEAIGLDIQKSATEAISAGRTALGEQVAAAEDGLAQFGVEAVAGKSPMVDLKAPLKGVVARLEGKGHYVPKALGGRQIPMKQYALDPTGPEHKLVTKYLAKLNQDLDFGEALNLKRELDQVIHHGVAGSNGLQKVTGPANAILKDVRFQLKEAMTKSIPDAAARREWVNVNAAASEGYKAFELLEKQVIGAQPYQTAQRVARSVKNQSVEEMVLGPSARVSQKAEKAVEEIRDRVVAAQFKRRFTTMNASNFLPSSPRLVGNLTALLGGATDHAGGATRALASFAADHPNVTAQSLVNVALKHEEERRRRSAAPPESSR